MMAVDVLDSEVPVTTSPSSSPKMSMQHNFGLPPRLPQPVKFTTKLSDLLSSEQHEEESALKVLYEAHTTGPNEAKVVYNLPFELMDIILDHLVHTPKVLPFENRASLSTESFASAPPHIPEDKKSLKDFRRVCSKFFHAGRGRLFGRLNIRFSIASFERLREIAECQENQWVPLEVQKLSYMVHDLYAGDQSRLQEVLQDCLASMADCQQRIRDVQACRIQDPQSILAHPRLNAELARFRRNEQIIRSVLARAKEQQGIVDRNIDQQNLEIAFTKFKNLQQVRLMRNFDQLDRDWKGYLDSRPALRDEFGSSQWNRACERATMVLGRAYLASESRAFRLSSRFMDPRPAWLLEHMSKADISSYSSRLECLELQIGDPFDLETKINELSSVLNSLFKATSKMKGLHIGLLRPISNPLETIFHDVTWTRLQYIGLSRWDLHSNEIISFIGRHKGCLTSVRFREVRLKDGSWLEIVRFLRENTKLKWASFRQIGYNPKIGGGPILERGRPPAPSGFAMLHGPPTDDDEYYSSEGSDDIGEHVAAGHEMIHQATGPEGANLSEDDDSEVDSDETLEPVASETGGTIESVEENEEATLSENDNAAGYLPEGDSEDGVEDSISGSVAGDSDVGVVNELALDDRMMVQHSSTTSHRASKCNCSNGYGWHDLEDDHGLDPTKAQWKSWERWVTRVCKEHDPAQP